jgi:hypothetical protein
LPAPDEARCEQELAACEAVQLFVERASAASPSFGLSSANTSTVTDLCRRLDGIPLALELAAARMRAMSIDAIAARLDDRLRFLKLEAASAEPRHQALRVCLDWSHDLLSERERVVLRRLAVFVGGCTIDAAEAVVAGDPVPREDVVDCLANLVEKSMVEHDARTDRYSLLETVRQYALEHLSESGEERETRARHLRHFVELAEAACLRFIGPEPHPWFVRFDADRENLLAAHAFCDEADEGAEQGLRLAGALAWYWIFRPLIDLGWRTMLEALARSGVELYPALRAIVAVRAGYCAFFMNDYASVRQFVAQSLDVVELPIEMRASARRLLGMVLYSSGNPQAAMVAFEGVLGLRSQLREPLHCDMCLVYMGHLHVERGDFEKAERLYAESLAVLTEKTYPYFHVTVLLGITTMSLLCGSAARARDALARAMRVVEKRHLTVLRPQALDAAAGLAAVEGDAERAARYLGAASAELAQTRMHYAARASTLRAPLIRGARDKIGAKAFAAAEERGRALSYEEALAEAREWLMPVARAEEAETAEQ